jgi:tetratricopeptide (TPR) repeat protein
VTAQYEEQFETGYSNSTITHPVDKQTELKLAEGYKKSNDWDKAIDVYQSLIEEYPDEADEYWLEIASCYSSKKDYDTAITIYKQITTSSPDTAMKAWFYTGWCYQRQDKLSEAITAYKAVLTSAPADTAKDNYYTLNTKVHLAECYWGKSDLDNRITQYLAAAADCPQNAGNYKLDVARLYLEKKEFDKTNTVCEDVIAHYPKLKERALTIMGECLFAEHKDNEAQQKFDELIAYLQAICDENPGSSEALEAELRIARIEFHALNHCDKAQMLLRDFMTNHPDYEPMITVAYDIADCSYWKGSWSKAITLFEEARKCKDYSDYQAKILYMIADSYMRLRDHANAKKYADILISTYPTDCWAELAVDNFVQLTTSEVEYEEAK